MRMMDSKHLSSPRPFRSLIIFFRRLILLFFSVLPFVFLLSTTIPLPRSKLSPAPVVSFEIRDRNGMLLRELLSDEGGRCRWISLEEVSPHLIRATIAAEDNAFLFHRGLNALAVGRAVIQNLFRGRIVSGGSTISQQLARNLQPGRRTLLSKLREAWLALRLERTLTKEEILVEYLNRIYYGNQAYGAEAASRLYFGKPCSELSLNEAAFLAGLPRSPSLLNPYKPGQGRKDALERQQVILSRLRKLGFYAPEEIDRALREELLLVPAGVSFRAPHFCDWLLSWIPSAKRRELNLVQTTLDYNLQRKIEAMLSRYLGSLSSRGITNGAVVVLDNATSEIVSLVGSKDFFDETRSGQVNGALSRRQPGSTLKPFTYALALEKGLTAASIVDDARLAFPTESGAYVPLNYDRKYHGPMSLRTALACSYNVPAVSLLERLGSDLLYRRLKMLGFKSLDENPGYYGVGLTLGNGDVTLLELVRAYAALARGGIFMPEKILLRVETKTKMDQSRASDRVPNQGRCGPRRSVEARSDALKGLIESFGKRVFSPQVAYVISDILSDKDARIPSFGLMTPLSFPFPVASKTGTSKGFRDNWTVGFTPRYTVGVWMGNFDGKPMENVSGITGCGPLFHDIMLLLYQKREWEAFEEPPGIVRIAVCPESGELPSESCPTAIREIFIEGTEPRSACSLHSRMNVKGFHPAVKVEHLFSPLTSENLSSPPEKQQDSAASIRIIFPRDGDVFKLDPILRQECQQIKLRASVLFGGRLPEVVEWYVNERKIGRAPSSLSLFWNLKPGSYTIKAKLITGAKTKESLPVRIHVLT